MTRRAAAVGLVGILGTVFLTMLISLAAGVIIGIFVPTPSDAFWNAAFIVDKWTSALLALACAASLLRWHSLSPASFGLHVERFAAQTAWGIAALVAVYVAFGLSLVAVTILIAAVPSLQQDLAARGEFLALLPVHDTLGAILLLIPVAIHEELLFRGLLLPYLRRVGCSWTAAVLVSAAIFASLHVTQGWLAIPQIFCVAVALGTVFVVSRSLSAVMIAHFLFDFLQLQLIRVLWPWLEQYTKQG